MTIRRVTGEARAPNVRKIRVSSAAKLQTVLASALEKLSSNAKKLGTPTTKSAAKIKIADRRIDRSRTVHPVLRISCASIAALLFLLPLAGTAQTRSAGDLFAQGRAAFERQDFTAALVSFEAALAARMEGPAIHYNIGVAAFRLQQYDRARRAFEQVAQTPEMTALAHYNLGLIARAEGNDAQAREFFTRVRTETQDARLQSLAARQLGEQNQAAPFVWGAFAASGLGYDDNVTLTANGEAIGIARESDVYGDTQLVGSLSFGTGWRVDGDLSFLNYVDLNEFDQWGLGFSGRYRFALQDWTADAGAQLSAAWLDGDAFEQRQSMFMQATRSLNDTWRVRGRVRLSNINGASEYPGYDGLRHEASVRFNRDSADWMMSVAYLFEVNDYDSAALSAVRHLLLADARRIVTSLWSVRGTVSYRLSEYDEQASGTENRIELMLGAERALTDRWYLVLQYLFTDNSASTPLYDYQRNRLFAGVEATF
jgi:tetratricopeptide (TPR) repeat protein